MSGKRHHVIPQFLLEGFASHWSGDAAYTWMYRRGGSLTNPNVANVAVEGRFYEEDQDRSVDDLITIAEGRLSTLVRELRMRRGECVPPDQVAELLAHFEVRTRHLRESFLRTGQFVVSSFMDLMQDEEAFAAFLLRRLRSDPSLLREGVAKELLKRKLPPTALDSLMQRIEPLVPGFVDAQKTEFSKVAAALRPLLRKALKEGAKAGHLKALRTSIAPILGVDRYSALAYVVAEAKEESLILGDSVVLFHVEGPKSYKAFVDAKDVVNAIFLPLDPRTVLIGTRSGFAPTQHGFREAIARCSLEYFVAAEATPEYELLQHLIGADAAPLTDVEMQQLFSELMHG